MHDYLHTVDSLAGLAHLTNRLGQVAAGDEPVYYAQYHAYQLAAGYAPPPSPRPAYVRPWHPTIAALWGIPLADDVPEPSPHRNTPCDGGPESGRFRPLGLPLEEDIFVALQVARILASGIGRGPAEADGASAVAASSGPSAATSSDPSAAASSGLSGGVPLVRTISNSTDTGSSASADSFWSQASRSSVEAPSSEVPDAPDASARKSETLDVESPSMPLKGFVVTKETTAADLVRAWGVNI